MGLPYEKETSLSTPFAPPKAFISYAWENPAHKQWVRELAVKLRVDGVNLLLDQWELAPGDQLAQFMETSVRDSDSVLIVCTPAYKAKSDDRAGGVGYEGSVITAEVVAGKTRRKFIPLLRRGEWVESAPSWLLGSVYLDFRLDGVTLEEPYADLLDTLHGSREGPPPVGSPPFPRRHRREPEPIELPQASGKSWQQVWTSLFYAAPHDPQILHKGRQWLRANPSHPRWPHVLNSLVKVASHDSELLQDGKKWLLQNDQNYPGWTLVWKALMDAWPHDPELFSMGQQWLESQ